MFMKNKGQLHAIIKQSEREIFHNLLRDKGFEYTFENFINILYPEKDITVIREYLFNEFDKIQHYSLDEYMKCNFSSQIYQILFSQHISNEVKVTIIYNIFSRTVRNLNIKRILEQLLIDMISNLLNVYDFNDEIINVSIRVFNLIFKNPMCFTDDIEASKQLFKAVSINLSGFPISTCKTVKRRVLTNILVLSWGYVKIDSSINKTIQERIYNNLIGETNIEFTGKSVKIIDLIKKNVSEIIEGLNYINFDELGIFKEAEYYSFRLIEAKYVVFTRQMISSIYSFLFVLSSERFVYDDIFSLNNMTDENKYYIVKHFIDQFDVENGSLQFKKEFLKDYNMFLSFLNLDPISDKQIGYFMEESFKHANSIARDLKEKGYDKNITHVMGSNVPLEKEFLCEAAIKYSYKTINSNNFLAGKNDLEGDEKALINYNFGINDGLNFNDNVLFSLLDSSFEHEVVKYVLFKHLERLELKTRGNSCLEFVSEIDNRQLNTISNNNFYNYRFDKADNDEIELYKNLKLEVDNRRVGYELVVYNKDNFSYRILPVKILRYKLSDDEIEEYINSKVKVAFDMYNIRGLYYSFEEAFDIIKRDFYRDEVQVRYIVECNEKPGIIVDFVK